MAENVTTGNIHELASRTFGDLGKCHVKTVHCQPFDTGHGSVRRFRGWKLSWIFNDRMYSRFLFFSGTVTLHGQGTSIFSEACFFTCREPIFCDEFQYMNSLICELFFQVWPIPFSDSKYWRGPSLFIILWNRRPPKVYITVLTVTVSYRILLYSNSLANWCLNVLILTLPASRTIGLRKEVGRFIAEPQDIYNSLSDLLTEKQVSIADLFWLEDEALCLVWPEGICLKVFLGINNQTTYCRD